MGYDHLRIKSNAKLFYRNNQGYSILAVLILLAVPYAFGMIAGMITGAIQLIIGLIFGVNFASMVESGSSIPGGGFAAMVLAVIVFYILILAVSLVCAAVAYLMTMGAMDWFRRSIYEKVSLKEIFRPFYGGRLWSNISTYFLMQLFIFLWSMLFIIPGIIKGISYSMTLYIKMENPNISPSRAIEISKLITDGHKWDLFYLNLSFLGWFLLSMLTYNILGVVYVFPYYYAARAFAYEEIKAEAAARGVLNISELRGYDRV